jgi:hypothetical protein
MQNFSNLLDAIKRKGIFVSVVDGRLKVEPASKITDEIRASIKEHRQGIIAALTGGGMPVVDQVLMSGGSKLSCQTLAKLNVQSAIQEAMSGKSDGQKKEPPKLGAARICLLCGIPLNLDGGDCWHKAFHVGDDSPTLDCPNQPPKVGAATSSPISKKATTGPRCDDQVKTIQPHVREQINPVALSWLRENRQGLKAAGWPASQLWRKNESRGIAWMSIWGMPGLSVVIQSDGCICFHFLDNGKQIKQTAWPMPQRKIKSRRNKS